VRRRHKIFANDRERGLMKKSHFRPGKSPADLAAVVHAELRRRASKIPALDVLTALFECLYFASLKTEEAESIKIHVAYIDPRNPDPSPPKRCCQDRWTHIAFKHPVTMTVSNLVKIAKASDPRSSSFAVYADETGRLSVWGLIDQGNRYYEFINYESDAGPDRPGIFQASIEGIGHIVTYIGYDKLAELKVNTLVRNARDVLRGGPVSDKLDIGIRAYLDTVEKQLPKNLRDSFPDWVAGLSDEWTSSICRLLLRVQNYHHGGTILITGDSSFSGLRIKHRIEYPRLSTALARRALFRIQESNASDEIFEEYIEKDSEDIPVELYFDESINSGDYEDGNSEVEGAIWFISLLTRVDGLVLMNPSLEVKGFGVEITFSDEPPSIFMARDRRAKDKHLRKLDYERFGTRHRSVMRYCSKISNSVGFVISQDGDVRVMTQVRGKLVVWENLRLQLHDFIRQAKVRKKIVSEKE